MVDIKVAYDGSYPHCLIHLKLPSRSLRLLHLKAAKTAQPTILEPMMLVTITVPENLGDIMGA